VVAVKSIPGVSLGHCTAIQNHSPAAFTSQLIVFIVDRTFFQRQTTAANAAAQRVSKALQVTDAGIQVITPVG
jgi:hypothetical protein